MRKNILKLLTAALILASSNLTAFQEYAQDLETIRGIFAAQYAPSEWKKNYFGWDLDIELQKCKDEILQSEGLSKKGYHKILRKFFNSTRDYHVQVNFASTEKATLPFFVRRIEGRCYIAGIDRDALPETVYNINRGDELIAVDGKPIQEIFAELEGELGYSAVSPTENSLLDLALTYREGAAGDTVPYGPARITLRSCDTGAEVSYQLIWNYTPEVVLYPKALPDIHQNGCDSLWLKGPMLSPRSEKLFNHFNSIEGFLPHLGDGWVELENPYFHAYIFENTEGNLIGFLRIPHFSLSYEKLEELGRLINIFEKNTDALIIDQTNNPGGMAFHLYIIASMLTDHPLKAPKHRLALTPTEVLKTIKELEVFETITTQDQAESCFDWKGYPISLQYIDFRKEHLKFLISQWIQGKRLTDPTYIVSIDEINPHPEYRYSKPILMLVNELDFSGGDFFPAIMQDNKRAVIMGCRTGGAGGYIKRVEFPNQTGIDSFIFTVSIAERAADQPIENLGVTPDIEYGVTCEDLKQGYRPYARAINEAVRTLLR